MKIIPNFAITNNNTVKNTPSFAQNPQNDKKEVNSVPNFTADYHVNTPVSYKKIEDIKLFWRIKKVIW